MLMTPATRKVALTAHVLASLGWFGSVAAFLALAMAGLNGDEPLRVRSAYLSMELTGWYVTVPLAFATLITGVIQGAGTRWGLFEHYWVVAKLLITIVATAVLLVHMGPTSQLAALAAERALEPGDLDTLRARLVANAIAALLALVVATGLAVYKPRGLTPLGRLARQRTMRLESAAIVIADRATPGWVRVAAIGLLVMILVFLALHLAGGGMSHHRRLAPGARSVERTDPAVFSLRPVGDRPMRASPGVMIVFPRQ